ncbi:MAG: Fe-S protein assembly chaperone HscA [Sphingobacteriales bacterium 17-39-43]|uniref:Fe-S protein assembly chaperone HscA n=1 Tax=Daejeonella sp. TaxID=2805397 RepID=UPI000BD4D4AD|nr:Fe-S protein assembly chaperone HscA [Daejeonella sp.]OYY04178.1 MAG: Fe-S protein assembly chaperone HscA [Sphingobacteriia bacterium 35-40-5]OYZ30485.1 MAG: Fe-S protein assembly chaperone HscA [Sphingobacteriales bacterium 16-39-50]OZA23132.1 MAG: Fe-S protein assembly chaperone HscA [Sphingobacteriales bacterium 17-39-43]HQT24717.1 Fe-S protein assembly chaperone HscA [Daejeonella sp.]HQT59403.1 Fe-S protein assembly chaperone HscA [Daejeonella sp.]
MAKVSINIATGSVQKEEIIVGIDLGTTNSLVAFINPEGQPQVINDTGKGVLVPSVVHFQSDGGLIVGNEAKEFLISDPQNTIFSVKRLLGRSFKDIQEHSNLFSYKIIDDDSESLVKIKAGDKYFTPIELSGMILKELKERAEHALKTLVNRAVITVPAYFNDSQRQATRDAGKLAGLDVLRIVNEPTAASLAYGIGLDPEEEKIIAVYDLGGGTFDVSILKIQNGIFEVLSTNGDTFLGGDDFDRAIVNYWIEQNQLGDRAKDSSLNQALRLKAEEAKKALTTQNIFNGFVDNIPCAITKQKFEELILSRVEQTITCCKNALKDASLNITDIQEVVMVGGSTRTPLVKQMVAAFFEKEVHDQINPDEVVALGAAIQSDILAGNRKDILLLDVTPLSLGIETMGGLMDVIIPRNAKVPAKAGRQYTTSIDGQINMKISVFQGERDLVSENRKLAEFDLKGIPAMPAGFPKVDINFRLNADGILTVEAVELRSGVKQEVEVKPTYGLTDEQVEKMLIDSIENAKDDVSRRMLIEARTEGEQMVYTVEHFLEKNSEQVSEQETEDTQKLIGNLKSALGSGDKDLIHKSIDELNEFTRPFAERLMNTAISSAMKGKAIE